MTHIDKDRQPRIEPTVGKHFPFRMANVTSAFDGYLVRPHWHEHLEFIKIKKGHVQVTLDDQTFLAVPDDIIYVGSGKVHAVQLLPGQEGQLFGMIFDPFFIINLLEGFETRHAYESFISRANHPHVFSPHHPLWTILNDGIETSHQEYNERDLCYEMAIKSCIYRMTTALIRHDKQQIGNSLSSIQHMHQIRPALNYIEEHFAEPLYLDDLCQLVNMSRFHFSRRFKQATGMTLARFITLTRINVAKKMIVEQELTITEIADQTGFCNPHYFGKVFKDCTGMSPLQFRNEVKYHPI